MKQLTVCILFGIMFLALAAPAQAQQPIGPQPLGPQPGEVIPQPDHGPIISSVPIPPPPPPPPGDPSIRHAVVVQADFLYGFNLWTDHWQFGCNRAPSLLMRTVPGEHITVQLNPGRGLDGNTWVYVLDGWYRFCYVQTFGLSIS